jgi:hypothetical protein
MLAAWNWIVAVAAAGAPDRVAHTIELGDGNGGIDDIAISDDPPVGYPFVAFHRGGDGIWVLDLFTWEASEVKVCTGGSAQGIAAASLDGGAVAVVTACDNGQVMKVIIAGDIRQAQAEPLGSYVAEGQGSQAPPVYDVETDGQNVYVVMGGEGNSGAMIQQFSLQAGMQGTWGQEPKQVTHTGTPTDTLLAGSLYIVWGDPDVTTVSLNDGNANTPNNTGSAKYDEISPGGEGTSSYLWLASGDGDAWILVNGSSQPARQLTDLGTKVSATAASEDGNWFLAAVESGSSGVCLAYDSKKPTSTSASTEIEDAGGIREFAVYGDYAFGATDEGTVLVLTEVPWVEMNPIPGAEDTVDGDELEIGFSSDTSGTYTVTVGGEEIASGDIEADTPVTESYTVQGLSEGPAEIEVRVAAGTRVGRDGTRVNVNNPPPAPDLYIGRGDEHLLLTMQGVDDEDLASFAVYVRETPFEPGDYESGGPDYDGEGAFENPIVVDATAGESVQYTLCPLINGTEYYVAVRSVDSSGKESPMSELMSGVPEETYSWAERSGVEDGVYCGLPLGAAGLAGAAVGVFAALRRRGRGGVRVVGVALAAAMALHSSPAHAFGKADESNLDSRHWNLSLRYGPVFVQNGYAQQVLGEDDNKLFRLDYGWAHHLLQVNLGMGVMAEDGTLVFEDGTSSSQVDHFLAFPFGLAAIGRLDFFDEQPLVPFGRVGVDYWLWSETWEDPADADETDTRGGGTFGWHWGAGLMLQLDWLDQGAASQLEALTSINDTYVVVEYRQSSRLETGSETLDLSSYEVTVGLQFDF